MRKFLGLILFLYLLPAHAQGINTPKGDWSFKSQLFKKEVKYVLNFEDSNLFIVRNNQKTQGPKLKIKENHIIADFGFGSGEYFLQSKGGDFLLCDVKTASDCEKLRSEKK